MNANEVAILIRAKDEATKTFKDVEQEANGLGKTLGDVGKIAGGFLAANVIGSAVDGFRNFIGGAVNAASDLGESLNAVNVVFKDHAQTVLDWGKNNATQFGLSQREFNQMATPLGAMLKNTGMDMKDVAGNTINLTKRAADMASVFNTDVGDALTAIQAALRGESDPIERYGVSLNAAKVEARALADTGKTVASTLTDQEKAAARLALLFEQTADVAGDFANTSDGLANSQRIQAARTEELQAKIGQKLIPVMLKINELKFALVQILADKLIPAFEAVGAVIGPIVATGFEKLNGAIGFVVDGLKPFVEYLRFAWEEGDTLNDFLESVPGPLQGIAKAFADVALFIRDEALPAIREFADEAFTRIREILTEQVIPAFEKIAPIVKQFATDVLGALAVTLQKDIIPKLEAMWPVVQKIAEVVVTQVVPAVAEFAKQVGDFLFPKIKTLIDFISDHKELLVGFAIALATLMVPAIIAWTVATIANTAAHIALAAATIIAYAPIVALVVAITLVVAAIIILIKHWDDVKAALGGFVEAAVNGFNDLKDKVAGVITGLGEWLLDHWKQIVLGVLAVVFPPGAGLFYLITHFDEVKAKLGEIAGAIKDALAEAFGKTKDAVIGVFGDLIGGAVEKMRGLKNDLLNAASDIKYGLIEAFRQTKEWLGRVWDGVVDVIKLPINGAIVLINGLISAWNGLHFGVGGGSFMGVSIPRLDIQTPDVGTIPYLANGGIVTRPTLAMIGEAGPEAVVPLSKAGMGTVNHYHINVQALDGTSASQIIMRELVKWERRGGIAPGTTRAVA